MFRQSLMVLAPIEADDGEGGQSVTWPDDGPTIWGDVQAVTAREQAVAGAIQTLATHRVSTYYDTRITQTCRLSRVNPAGSDLQILGIRDVDGKQRMVEIDCAEVVGGDEA